MENIDARFGTVSSVMLFLGKNFMGYKIYMNNQI
jgi:hypothetical protein